MQSEADLGFVKLVLDIAAQAVAFLHYSFPLAALYSV
jgi:hypothetical protein